MQAVVILLVGCAAICSNAVPLNEQKIIGGWVTSVDTYPDVASLLYAYTGTGHRQACGGAILNARSILTAAHCVWNDIPSRWRIRVGSSKANTGGSVYNVGAIIVHEKYNRSNYDFDMAILRTTSFIEFNNIVRAASFAGSNYHLGDSQPVRAIGWGSTVAGGTGSEDLRHVLLWTVNQGVCRRRYALVGSVVTDNMLCSGWLNVGGRDQCQGDSGGPLYHNKVVVGVCSWGRTCAQALFPGVNARVSRFTSWMQANA